MSKTATVTGGALRMRQGASKGEKVLALIPDGTVIEVTGGEGEWRQVRYAGMTGWVMQKYLTENQTGEAEDDTETVQITLGREDAERLMNALALALDGA